MGWILFLWQNSFKVLKRTQQIQCTDIMSMNKHLLASSSLHPLPDYWGNTHCSFTLAPWCPVAAAWIWNALLASIRMSSLYLGFWHDPRTFLFKTPFGDWHDTLLVCGNVTIIRCPSTFFHDGITIIFAFIKIITSGQILLTTATLQEDFSSGKFNVRLNFFCRQPNRMIVDSMWGNHNVRTTGNRKVHGGMRENPDVIPSKVPLPVVIWTHLINSALGTRKSTSQMACRLVRQFSQGSWSLQTDRLTDHPTPSVAIGRI